MVRMREELRKYGLPETVELPDHIAHVLSVVAAMPCGRSHAIRLCLRLACRQENEPGAVRTRKRPTGTSSAVWNRY